MAASPAVKPLVRSGQSRPSASLTQLAERDEVEGNEERDNEAREQSKGICIDDVRPVLGEEMQETFRGDEAGQDSHNEIGRPMTFAHRIFVSASAAPRLTAFMAR